MMDSLMGRRKRGLPDKAKAGKILQDGSVKGNPLTSKQKGFFGAIAGGANMTARAARRKARRR